MDFIFLLDIFVNFNSAMENESYQIIDDRKMIARHYLRGWFLIDFISVIPVEHIWRANASNLPSFLRIIKIGKVQLLVKVSRLARILKVVL